MPETQPYVVRTQVRYDGELKCSAVHLDSSTTLRTVAPKDNQGDGSTFSPTDLVGVAMGTCMLTIMGIAARRDGIDLAGAEVTIDKEMTAQPPRRIARLTCGFTVPANLTDDEITKLRRAAETCPVHRSLHPDVKVELDFARR